MLKRLVYIAVILSLVFAASIASADSVTLNFVSVTNGLGGGYTPVNIFAGPLGNVGGVEAGIYNLNVNGTLTSGFCIEPAFSSSSPLTYELQNIVHGSAFAAAAWILSQGYTGISSAAAQIAVWELTWDAAKGTAFNLATGNFQLLSNPELVAEVANIYNNALAAALAGWDPSHYALAVNPLGSDPLTWIYAQNYIIPQVPLPPSVLLLGSGLLGLVGFGWRRSKKS